MSRWLLLLLALGCEPTKLKLGRDGTYFRDGRTNLCFVYWMTWSQSGNREIATHVPCTAEVERLIREGGP